MTPFELITEAENCLMVTERRAEGVSCATWRQLVVLLTQALRESEGVAGKLRAHSHTLFSRLKAAHSLASQDQHFTQYDSFATEEAISKFIREFPPEAENSPQKHDLP